MAKEQAEQQRQAEAQKQREQMTEEQRLIDDLRSQLQEKTAKKLREEIGRSPLYDSFKKLIEQATNWQKEDKAALHQLGKDILLFINAKDNKRAKDLLKTLI